MQTISSEQDYLTSLAEEQWFRDDEGQLSVDVRETENEIIIVSAIAGVDAEDIDIAVTSDTITIRGQRLDECQERDEGIVHIKECYWGKFSRSIVLPHHIKPDEADAVLQNGILTVRLKKAEMSSHIPVVSMDDF